MKSIWFFIYNIFVLPILRIVFFITSLFNRKVREGFKGRKRLFEKLIINLADLNRDYKLIWFHSSSMGEFEQAKPIIQKLKSNLKVNILVTFFSPSGYNNSLKYPHADIISYLPFDSNFYAKRFINLVRPSVVIFMRYDFWPNFIWNLNKYKIPTFIVDATMTQKSKRKWFISKQFHKDLFKYFLKILVISEEDKQNFKEFNIPNNTLSVVGDTRFDRVYQKSIDAKSKNLFREEVLKGKKVLVIGSSWEADEEIIIPAIKKLIKYMNDVLIIIAPHEPTTKRLEELEYIFEENQTVRFSFMNNYKNEKIILIDSIGILLTLYFYADLAYVGGSFKQGIHNVLEPAVYGIPVIFGPKNKNSQEAQKMKSIGCGIEIKSKIEAYKIFRKLLSDDLMRNQIGDKSNSYVQSNLGATDRIIKEFSRIRN